MVAPLDPGVAKDGLNLIAQVYIFDLSYFNVHKNVF